MKIITFGELLLRLTSPGYTKLFQKDSLDASFCGGEANVAVSLANFGLESVFVSRMPNSSVGIAGAHSLDYFNVDTSKIVYGNGRMGLYYLEKGASQRSSNIIYDREYSSFALAQRGDFDWDCIFDGADWFHWTGINPALSSEMGDICEDACRYAKEKGITISCDLNYRGKLWSPEKAQTVMKPLMKYVDLCICNEEDAEKVLGLTSRNIDVEEGKLSTSDYSNIAKQICDQYGCNYVATTLRRSYSASRNGWGAMLFDAKELKSYFSREYDVWIVDRVGGGDSFSAALIYAFSTSKTHQEKIEFAAAASCLKQTIEGDYNRVSVNDVEDLVHSSGNGRVKR